MPAQSARHPAVKALLAAADALAEALPDTDRVEVVWRHGDTIIVRCDLAGCQPPPPPPVPLNEIERDVVEAIGTDVLTAKEVARKSGYPDDSGLRSTLARLRRLGVLSGGAGEAGYGVAPEHQHRA